MTNICLYQRQFCPTRAPYGAITITRSPDTRTPTVTGLTTRAPPKIQMKDNHGELPFLYQHFSRSGLFQVCCFFSQLFLKSFVLNRCATEVDQDGYVVDNAWGDCLDGCPGTRKHFREDLRPKLAYGWQGLGWDHWATWARIQFGQVHFGVFSTSRFTRPALSLVWILLIKCVYTLEWAKRGFMGFYVLGWVNFGRKCCFC